MVASADRHAAEANDARLSAEARLETLQEELDALRILYETDVQGLQEEVDEMRSERGGDGASGAGPEAAAAEIARLTKELDAERLRAARAEATATDAREELAASRALAAEEDAMRAEDIAALSEKLRQAERALAEERLGGGGGGGGGGADASASGDDAMGEASELREQVAGLLEVLEQREAAMQDFMALRVRVAELEAELAEARE